MKMAACGDGVLNTQRVFKKSSPNNKLTMYLSSRDLILENGTIDKLYGVVHAESDLLEKRKIFGQVTLTFRYGREDEEVMGLKFCNEAIMCLAQIWPPFSCHEPEPVTPLQEALIKRLGSNAHPFHMELTPLAPPSVQLVPAKQYHGAPIGTSYDVRAYVAERADEKIPRRSVVRMGIRVLQGSGRPLHRASAARAPHLLGTFTSPQHNYNRLSPKRKMKTGHTDDENNFQTTIEQNAEEEPPPPRAAVDKPFLLSDGRVELEAWLDKATYSHGESLKVSIAVANNSQKTVRRIKVLVIQHVDVCMFSNGKFKNVVAIVKADATPVMPGRTLTDSYVLTPHKGVTKNWIALEDSYTKTGASLASSVPCNSKTPEERNVFAIYVSYYVKVKLTLSAMGGELSVKLPFTLTHSCGGESCGDSFIEELSPRRIIEGDENSEEENKDDDRTQLYKLKEGLESDFDEDTPELPRKILTDAVLNTVKDSLERDCVVGQRETRQDINEEDLNVIVKYTES